MNPTEKETALWMALNLAQRSVYRTMDSALKAKGLPPLRWYDVLWAIERANDRGLRPFELEKLLIFDQSNLSRLIRRLIGEDLAQESVFETDKRGKVLKITSKGRCVREQMWKIYGPLIHRHMSQVSEEHDPDKLAAALNQLIGKV